MTTSEKKPDFARPNKPQEAYDALEKKKSEVALLTKERHEELILENADYERVCRELAAKTEAKHKIELNHDQKHPKLADKIASAKGDQKDLADRLSFVILNAIKAGEKVEIYRTLKSGKKKKISPKFKVSFQAP